MTIVWLSLYGEGFLVLLGQSLFSRFLCTKRRFCCLNLRLFCLLISWLICLVEKRLVEEVRKNDTLIIVGETGSGKTTRKFSLFTILTFNFLI